MTTIDIYLVIAVLAVITGGTRGSFLVFAPKVSLPASLQRALRFVPAAVFPALIAPEFLMSNGHLALTTDNLRLLAGLMAGMVALKTGNTLATIVTGMLILHAAGRVLGA